MSTTERPQAVMSNPRADRVKDVARLAGRSVRLKRGQFLAEGPQAVREALVAHREAAARDGRRVVAELYATTECLDRFPELAELAGAVPVRLASDEVLAAIASTVTPQGVLAVCYTSEVTLEQVLESGARLLAVLCRVQDPGNAGTILRAADAAGADAVVLTESSVDIYNPKAVRSTAGSLFHLPVVTGQDFDATVAQASAAGLAVLAADGYGSVDLDELQDRSALRRLAGQAAAADLPQDLSEGLADSSPRLEAPTAWLFGNEAQGLSTEELAAADHRVAVPLYGIAESLNVATAATVCLYASARAQRRPTPASAD